MSQSDSTWVLASVHVEGFLGVGSAGFELELDRPIIVLLGNNGCGKSTLLQAIEWALFGVTAVGSNGEELKGTALETPRTYINRGCEQASVVLRFQGGGRTLEWTRTRTIARPRPSNDFVECRIDGELPLPTSASSWASPQISTGGPSPLRREPSRHSFLVMPRSEALRSIGSSVSRP